MAAILIDIQSGDEVIIPSYTFVSTANAFVLRGAKIVFCDSRSDHPGMDENKIEELITPKTKAIVPVHYAGVACDMDKIMALANKYNLFVVEDAAQAIESFYKGKPLGGIGHLGCYSFHETKNITSGEGGLLIINDERYIERAEIIWEKGTNRQAFFRGEVYKYGWIDIGSSFLPSDITAAFLYAQLENIDDIQKKRLTIWNKYYETLYPIKDKLNVRLPFIPDYATNNAHMFYIIAQGEKKRAVEQEHGTRCLERGISYRDEIIYRLRESGILAAFHYHSLDKSHYHTNSQSHELQKLFLSHVYSSCLLRLPLYTEIHERELMEIRFSLWKDG